MKRTFITFFLLATALLIACPTLTFAKKEKKPYEWVPPKKLSGDKDMDQYLLACDTLWTKMQHFKDSITFFQLDTLKRIVDGEPRYIVKIRDQEGNDRNFSQSLTQGIEIIGNGSLIVLNAANISLLTTTAGLSIVSNPLLAFSYGKYLKAGPLIVKLAYNEIREIVNATKLQMKQTKAMRTSKLEGSTDQAYILAISEEEQASVNLEDFVNLEEGELGNNDNEIDIPEEELADEKFEELAMPEEKKEEKK